MAEQANPFNLDFLKLMQGYKVPGVDMEALFATQRRNLEALQQMNSLAAEGMQAVARRQGEILRATMDEYTRAARELAEVDPDEKASKQAEFAKEAFEKAVANMRELSEMIVKSQNEAVETINKRVAESLDEFKEATKPSGQ